MQTITSLSICRIIAIALLVRAQIANGTHEQGWQRRHSVTHTHSLVVVSLLPLQ